MRSCVTALLVLSLTPLVNAEGEATAEQLQRMYDNAVAQLRAAQDRRNELARENEKLDAAVKDLQKQLAEARGGLATLTATTFQLRAEYGAFQDFLRRFPAIEVRWRGHMSKDLPATGDNVLDLLNSDWPFDLPARPTPKPTRLP